MIQPPALPEDHPDYVFECEQALAGALNKLGDAAVDAGWHDAAVDAALLRLIRDRVFGHIDDSDRDAPQNRDRERTPSCRNGPTSTDTDRQPSGLARRRHILSQSYLIGAFGPLSRFWSNSTMPAGTAAVRKTVPNGAADALPALIVLGLDDSGKAHASWFDDAEADIARSAASLMGTRSLPADTEALQTIAARLPHGRIFPSGKAFVPFVKAAVYEQLAGMLPKGEAAPLRLVPGSKGKAAGQAKGVARGAAKASAVGSGSGGRGGEAGAASGSDDRPADWQKLKAGSVVLITEGDQEGWFEAVSYIRPAG